MRRRILGCGCLAIVVVIILLAIGAAVGCGGTNATPTATAKLARAAQHVNNVSTLMQTMTVQVQEVVGRYR